MSAKGFGLVPFVVIAGVMIIVGFVVWRLWGTHSPQPRSTNSEEVTWSFNGDAWEPSGNPPDCPNPVELMVPVDVSLASAVLYPGQTRGGNYKPHGGFLFQGKQNSDITVRAPMDATLVSGSRYLEQGEEQTLLFFINDCGLAYRFDHLLTLAPDFRVLSDTLPQPKVDDSRTARFAAPRKVKAGEVIATAVGFKNNLNVSVDFGVYDLRQPNDASKAAVFAQAHQNDKEQAWFGVCWFDLLAPTHKIAVKALPAGDAQMGKTSDYCK